MDQSTLDQGIKTLLADLEAVAGTNSSALLYGSAARGDWLPGRSDVNVLLVVDDASPPSLRKLTRTVIDWHDRGFTPPLIIGREEWAESADVFPIEITDMQLAHRVLRGSNPLAAVAVKPDDLRRAVEGELRGKQIRLRQAYVRFAESTHVLGGMASSSVSSLLVLLRCTAVLLQRTPGRDAKEVVVGLRAELGPEGEAVVEIAAHRRERDWNCSPEMYVRYLDVVGRAVDLVDHFQRGDR